MGLLSGLFGGSSSQGSVDRTVARNIKLVRDSTGAPAVNLDKVEQKAGVDLRKKTEIAGESLKKHNLAGVRAQVALVVDHSGSMSGDYMSGRVQQLVERVLAFGLQMDADGSIPVIPFDNRLYNTVDVTLDNYKDIVNKSIYRPAEMGGTEYASPLKAIRDLAKSTDAPLFVCFVTDGDPWDKPEATQMVCDLARYPVFVKFLALRSVPYLDMLDDLDDSQRLLDNVDTKTFRDLNISDADFADAMADEFAGWIQKATSAGILTQ